MSRVIDRGAIVAGWVGVGMAVVVAVSFLLVIPIEPVFWLMTAPAGLLIGYYANQRSERQSGPWGRILANGVYAGAVTALTFVLLLLAVKALFFAADGGYRDPGQGGAIACATGADCVYQRYVQSPQGADLARAGVTDVASFTSFYWGQQLGVAGLVLVLCLGGGIAGALAFGASRPRGAPRVPDLATR